MPLVYDCLRELGVAIQRERLKSLTKEELIVLGELLLAHQKTLCWWQWLPFEARLRRDALREEIQELKKEITSEQSLSLKV